MWIDQAVLLEGTSARIALISPRVLCTAEWAVTFHVTIGQKHLTAIDLSMVREDVDNTDLAGEAACAGGACEVTF